jgi:starvation-inducible DNA-binding protein
MHSLNVYLSDLAVLNVKLHNLHWNVVGPQFVQLHEFTEKAYDRAFEDYDTVAELLKMRGESPLVSLKDYLANTTLQELPSKAFTAKELLDLVEADYRALCESAQAIRKHLDDVGDNTAVMVFDDFIAAYQKDLWFLKALKG